MPVLYVEKSDFLFQSTRPTPSYRSMNEQGLIRYNFYTVCWALDVCSQIKSLINLLQMAEGGSADALASSDRCCDVYLPKHSPDNGGNNRLDQPEVIDKLSRKPRFQEQQQLYFRGVWLV